MKKKLVAVLMTAALAATCLTGCGSAKKGTGEIKIWVAEAVVEFTQTQVAQFQLDNPEYDGYTITVEAVGEGDAAGNMITDVEGGADIFGFAQDQLSRLVSAGALTPIAGDNGAWVSANNAGGSVSAATVGDTIYAYPMTADNGYFLYYDKSVVTDPSTLEGILSQCEAAGKNFYFELNSAWYQTAYFFGTGAELTYDTDSDGNFTACNVSYATDKGVVALREMIDTAASPAFQNGSSISNGTNIGAIVDGTWDSAAAKEVFGANYACAKLPTFTGSDGATYQLSGFGGFKLLGVKPQEDALKLNACNAIAKYLTSEETQVARFNLVGWGPSNIAAQGNAAVQADEALTALGEQQAYTIPQGQYPGNYWSNGTSLGDDIIANGVLTQASSDEDLMAALTAFQNLCLADVQ